jgi:[ribosomal protein S18]-alanine N-acetyltransferase
MSPTSSARGDSQALADRPSRGDGDIQSIAVRADRQGQGLGRTLLAHVLAVAAARGCRAVFLYVRADNERARLLYQRTGSSRWA